MVTASTKSSNRKQAARAANPADFKAASQGAGAAPAYDISTRSWLIAAGVIILFAAVLRFYDLELVPLHHDEGVNGNFLVGLVRDGRYFYDPGNYHGPTIYYFAALFPWILRSLFGPNAQNNYGLTTVAIRAVPALFGLGTIGLVFCLRRNLGTVATLAAAALLTISPGAVYLSRYFIHETLFVFFTLGIVVAAVKYYEQGSPVYVLLCSISAALLFATKETAIISVAVLTLAFICTVSYRALRRRMGLDQSPPVSVKPAKTRRSGSRPESEFSKFVERAGGPRSVAAWSAIALAVFLIVNVLFYSSFFGNYPKGVADALKTFEFWTKTGKTAHLHPPATYIRWLLLQESPLLLLGVVGALIALLKSVKSMVLFTACWAFGLIAAYSLIGYKTPWLALNFVVPLALVSGTAIQWLYDELSEWRLSQRSRGLAVVVVLLLVSGPLTFMAATFEGMARSEPGQSPKPRWKTMIPGYQMVDLNFINYDNDDRYYVYVYAHTRRETLKLVEQIDQLAQRTHQGSQMGVKFVATDYWPLPWYLRDYKRVGYYGRISPSTEPVILATAGQASEVQTTFGDRYKQVHSGLNATGTFPLRPGVDLLLYTRRELVP